MTLEGKRILITGVVTTRSIAFAIAERVQLAGAETVLTSFGRVRRMTERAARRLPSTPEVLELDASRPEDFERLREDLAGRWGSLDGALHAIAFAPDDALGGNFLHTSPESAETAFRVSAFSYKALGEAVAPLMPPGGALVALDFDASVAWPVYDWMGVSKAALEAINRYLARDLGPRGIRANLISAGPLDTIAASGVPGFASLAAAWSSHAPLGWDLSDPAPVAETACFLFSDAARAITGEILHVDGGLHAVAGVVAQDEPELASARGRPAGDGA